MRPMVLLFVALFNSILGLSVLFPILAPLGRELGLGEMEIGSLSVAYASMQLVMAPFWGRRSDAWGRKPVLLIGIVGFSISFFAFAGVALFGLGGTLAHTPLLLLLVATRIFGGVFSSATLPTGQAYAADISGRDDRTAAMAVIGAAFGLGIIFGPGIGAGLASLFDDLLAPVWFSAGVAALNAVFVATSLPEPERRVTKTASRGARVLAKKVWPILLVGLGATVASVAMEQTIAFTYQDRLGLTGTGTAQAVGLALLAYGIVAVIAQGFIVRRFRLPPRTLLRVGLPFALVGFVVFIFAEETVGLTIALCLQGLGQGLMLPGVTAACSLAVSDSEQGVVAGLNSSAQGLGRTIGPIVGPVLYQQVNDQAPYVFSAALLGVMGIIVLLRPQIVPAKEPSSEVAREDPA
ncbi:MAG: MFS transporter [Sandaracinaceae bacterium]